MNSMLAIGTLLSLSAISQVSPPLSAQAPADPKKPAASAPRPTLLLKAFRILPVREAKLSANKHGSIVDLPVQEGQAVKAGDLLGQLDDREAQASIGVALAEVSVAEKQASSDAPVKAAEATHAVAKQELLKTTEINLSRPNTVNPIEVERLRLTMDKAEYQTLVAKQELEVAFLNIKVKEAQLQTAELEAELRKIRAPYDAEVIQVIRHVGEWVQAGDPVLHLIDMQHLRVQGYIYVSPLSLQDRALLDPTSGQTPASESEIFDPAEIAGRECEVIVELPKGKQEVFKAKVDFVSQVQETGGRVRVWVELENRKANGRWIAQPGQMANIKVLLDPPPPPKANPAKGEAAKPPVKSPAKPLPGRPAGSAAPPAADAPKTDTAPPGAPKSDAAPSAGSASGSKT